MNQEETKEKFSSDENTTASPQGNLNADEIAADVTGQENAEEIDNLPIESIGSYGRIEPLVNENTEYPEETDSER